MAADGILDEVLANGVACRRGSCARYCQLASELNELLDQGAHATP